MADNLRVDGRTPAASTSAAAGDKSTEKAVDRGRAQIDKLRELAKSRHGKVLSDSVLNAIVERREANVARQAVLAENKATFESELQKEVVGNRAQQVQSQKTTGAEKTRGSDGLTEKDRQSVRSDPKAGPTLPPAASKATTPEQAKQIIGKVFEHVMVDGQPVDLKQYSQTLKQRPPTQIPAQPGAPQAGGAPAQARSGQLPGQPPGSQPQLPGQPGGAPAQARSGQLPGQPPGSRPQLPGQPGGAPAQARSGQLPGQPPGTQPQLPGQPRGAQPPPPPPPPSPGAPPPSGSPPGAQPQRGTLQPGGQPSGAGTGTPTSTSSGYTGSQPPAGGAQPRSGTGGQAPTGSQPPPGSPGAGGAQPRSGSGVPGPSGGQPPLGSQPPPGSQPRSGTLPPGFQPPTGPGAGRGPAPMGGTGSTSGMSMALRGGSLPGGTRPTGGNTGAFSASTNNGGGLFSDTSFDGMNFNWDAFLLMFMIETQKDARLWRKTLRELQMLSRQVSAGAIHVQIAMTQMIQELDRTKELLKVVKEGVNLKNKLNEVENQKLAGENAQKATENRAAMRDAIRNSGLNVEPPGRLYLTPEEVAQLPPDQRTRYTEGLRDMRTNGGDVAYLQWLRGQRDMVRAELARAVDRAAAGADAAMTRATGAAGRAAAGAVGGAARMGRAGASALGSAGKAIASGVGSAVSAVGGAIASVGDGGGGDGAAAADGGGGTGSASGTEGGGDTEAADAAPSEEAPPSDEAAPSDVGGSAPDGDFKTHVGSDGVAEAAGAAGAAAADGTTTGDAAAPGGAPGAEAADGRPPPDEATVASLRAADAALTREIDAIGPDIDRRLAARMEDDPQGTMAAMAPSVDALAREAETHRDEAVALRRDLDGTNERIAGLEAERRGVSGPLTAANDRLRAAESATPPVQADIDAARAERDRIAGEVQPQLQRIDSQLAQERTHKADVERQLAETNGLLQGVAGAARSVTDALQRLAPPGQTPEPDAMRRRTQRANGDALAALREYRAAVDAEVTRLRGLMEADTDATARAAHEAEMHAAERNRDEADAILARHPDEARARDNAEHNRPLSTTDRLRASELANLGPVGDATLDRTRARILAADDAVWAAEGRHGPRPSDSFRPGDPPSVSDIETTAALARERANEANEMKDMYPMVGGRKALDVIGKAAKGLSDGMQSLAENKAWVDTVNQSVQGAINMAKQQRHELDGRVRNSFRQSQAMINQIMQVMALSKQL